MAHKKPSDYFTEDVLAHTSSTTPLNESSRRSSISVDGQNSASNTPRYGSQRLKQKGLSPTAEYINPSQRSTLGSPKLDGPSDPSGRRKHRTPSLSFSDDLENLPSDRATEINNRLVIAIDYGTTYTGEKDH
jgi:hypothetical protein